jgi:hypothetical protein
MRMKELFFSILPLLLWSCSQPKDNGQDTGLSPEERCGGQGTPSLEVGYGSGAEFWAYEAGAEVGLAPAPQGGFGVWVRAKTLGILAAEGDVPHATTAVLLETLIDGVVVGSFLNETVEVYCQADGTGLLWDVAVGFDQEDYATNDDLIALDGQDVQLFVEATDGNGNSASGTVDVVIAVGN